MPRCAPHELVRLRLISRAEALTEAPEEQALLASSSAALGHALGTVSASAAAASGAADAAAERVAQVEDVVEATAAVPECKRQRSWGERSLLTTLPTESSIV